MIEKRTDVAKTRVILASAERPSSSVTSRDLPSPARQRSSPTRTSAALHLRPTPHQQVKVIVAADEQASGL